MQADRNVAILKQILGYCEEIRETIERFGENYEVFSDDRVYQNSVGLCVLH